MEKKAYRMYQKNKKRKNQRIFYIAVIFLLLLCVYLLGRKKTPELPEHTGYAGMEAGFYENAWIVSGKENVLIFMADGILMQMQAEGISELNNTLADIETENGRVTRIAVKHDKIRGRVLAVGEDFIEIEGYGSLPLSKNFAVYQIYGELLQKDYRSILVGYDLQEFIVGDGQVCGAVIEEEAEKTLIRVLLRGNHYEGDSHERITLCSTEAMLLEYGKEHKRVEAGTELVLEPSSAELSNGRARISTESGQGMIRVTSLERAQGNPSYYGNLEVAVQDGQLTVVNEVDLEKYLYFVVPSEMPVSYGIEALKAQAVCARSYACRQIAANSLSEKGAHVDDSSNYQVYNNYSSAGPSNQAVDETRGQIITYEGEIAETYYFSTSCGYTTNADIWHSDFSLPYIQGRRVWHEGEEADFITVITDWDYPAYDMEFPWYRWYVDFSLEDLEKRVQTAGLEEGIGAVKSLEVSMRGKNGVAKAITVTGEKGSAVIEKEYAIRKFLNPSGNELHRKDGEILTDFSLLPSGFFLLKEIIEEGQVTGYRIMGGGFGHGAGMSQNAAKSMAAEGMGYLDILKFFYQGVEIENTLMPPAL